jgi:hypothetical protein
MDLGWEVIAEEARNAGAGLQPTYRNWPDDSRGRFANLAGFTWTSRPHLTYSPLFTVRARLIRVTRFPLGAPSEERAS